VTADGPAAISPKSLSDALAVLGVYDQPPTDAQLAAAEADKGRAELTARLANALYGAALARVMTAEWVASQDNSLGGWRSEMWRGAGADNEGVAILLHYSAMRLASHIRAIHGHIPVDLGVLGAADDAAEALKLLLEVTTVRSLDDPRAETLTTNLARASDRLATAAERIDTLFAAGRDAAAIIDSR
jgi:hypothetical protein